MANTPKVRVYREATPQVSTPVPATLPACIIGPFAQIMNYDEDKISSYVGVYGKDGTASIAEKEAWLGLGTSSPAFAGEFKGLDADAVPWLEKCKIIGEEVVVCVGIDGSTGVSISSNTVVFPVPINKCYAQPVAGDVLYYQASSGSVNRVNIVSVKISGSNYELTVSQTIPANSDGYFWSIERSISTPYTFDNNLIWPDSTNIKYFYIYQGSKINKMPIMYAKLYNSLVAPKVGLSYGIRSISSIYDIENAVGKVDVNNPLAFALYKALSGAPTTVYYLPVRVTYEFDNAKQIWKFSTSQGFSEAVNTLSSNNEVYRIVPLTDDIGDIGRFVAEANAKSLPDVSVFRKVYSSPKLTNEVKIATINGSTGTSTASDRTSISVSSGYILQKSKVTDYPLGGVERLYMGLGFVCDKVKIVKALTSSGNEVIEAKNKVFDIAKITIDSGNLVEIVLIGVLPGASNINTLQLQFYRYNGTELDLTSDLTPTISTPTTVNSQIQISNPASLGIEIGQYVRIPLPILGLEPFEDALYGKTVKPVQKYVEAKIVGMGSDYIQVDTSNGFELWSSSILGQSVANPTVYIIKYLTTESDIINALDNFTRIAGSPLVIYIYPYELTMELPNGEEADLPAYYYAAELAALRSIIPVHQGMTRYGAPRGYKIPAQFKRISRSLMERISNLGLYVLVQDSETAGAYCLHQLTSTRSGLFYDEELSCSENLDEISRSLKKIYDAFIGPYNITQQTIGLLYLTAKSFLDSKKAAFYPNIGPQLEDYSDLNVTRGRLVNGQYVVSPGVVTVSVKVKLPEPLNEIDIYIYY